MTRLHLVIWLLYFFFKLCIVTPSPCPVEAAHDFRGFLHGSHNVSVIKCFCVPFQTCSLFSCWYTRGFFLFQDIVLLAMAVSNSCVMALIDFFFYFPFILSFKMACIFRTNGVFTGETQGSNKETTFRAIKCLNFESKRTHLVKKKHQPDTCSIFSDGPQNYGITQKVGSNNRKESWNSDLSESHIQILTWNHHVFSIQQMNSFVWNQTIPTTWLP